MASKLKKNTNPPAAKNIEVEFAYASPAAKEVYLAGDFNNWIPDNLVMCKDARGIWRARVPLTPGRHEYTGSSWTASGNTTRGRVNRHPIHTAHAIA